MLQQITGTVQMDDLFRETKGCPYMNSFTGKQLHRPIEYQPSDRTFCPYGTRLYKVHRFFLSRIGLLLLKN